MTQLAVTEQDARELFTALDTRDADRAATYFTDDVRLYVGNGDPVDGREAVRELLRGFWSANRIVVQIHDITGVWSGSAEGMPVFAVEADVNYQLADGDEVTLRATSTLRYKDGLVADYRIFADMAPIMNRPAEMA